MSTPLFRTLVAGLILILAISVWNHFRSAGDSPVRDAHPVPLYADAASAAADTVHVAVPDYASFAHLGIPPLSPQEALERFRLEEGFRIELVAHEPDVIDPVAMDIDYRGRLWVVEMPSYMPVHDMDDRETTIRERVPQGRVIVLEDTSGDGRMDTRRIFMDGLILPRAIKVLDDGVLIAEPPYVWFIRDTTGDGIGDSREMVTDRYGDPATQNVEHMPNGLFWGMDNWIHSSQNLGESYRRIGDRWITRPFEPLPQWGMTQDDWGRIYSSHNTRTLNMHLVPYGYGRRHPQMPLSEGIYVNIAESETMWPAHPTGVNRGYRINQEVREDGTLKRSTSTCGPVIYRGDQFGQAYYGDAFVPEPAANLVKRLVGIHDDPSSIETTARFAYDEREFLTSTDERFRPVNMYNAPDGSLYLVDMYRGLFQHARFLTDHLRDYAVANDLHKPFGPSLFGRIYRIVREECEIDYQTPDLGAMRGVELAQTLRHPNGFLRDQAQQLLVQRSPASAVSLLEELAVEESEPFHARLQALWTLEGYDRSRYRETRLRRTAVSALGDTHPRIRAASIRILETYLRNGDDEVLSLMSGLVHEESSEFVRLQLLASLGESTSGRALEAMADLLSLHEESPYFREMALNGSYLREERLAGLLRERHGWRAGRNETQTLFFETVEEILEERRLADRDIDVRLSEGRALYGTCSVCHGADGEGISGVGPPLAGSAWVSGEASDLIRIVLHGFVDPELEDGYGSVMPAHGFLSDEETALLLSWLRDVWGDGASTVSTEEVRSVREASAGRTREWTPRELSRP